MLGKISRMLRKQQGFTLVELMTVLIILGVVLGIGIPKYLQIQAKAEWEADQNTIKNFAKAAETYAASMSSFDYADAEGLPISTLINDAKLIDGTLVLNRVKTAAEGSYTSEKNKDKKTVSVVGASLKFTFDSTSGSVNNLYDEKTGENITKAGVITQFIGTSPY